MFSFPLLYFFRDLFRESLFLRRMWPLTLSWRRSLRYRKQPPEVLVEKTFPYKVHKIHRKTHVPESLFLKSCRPRPRPATFFKKKLWHRCFPVNFLKFLRTPLQDTSGRLLLYITMVQLWKMWKHASQLRMRVLSQNSGN